MKRAFMKLLCTFGLAVLPIQFAIAQDCAGKPTGCFKPSTKSTGMLYKKELPTEADQLSNSSAYILVRMAKLADKTRSAKPKGGFLGGILLGSLANDRDGELVPLKEPTWSTVQFAPFDKENNDFVGKGRAKQSKAESKDSNAFYINPKQFFAENEGFRAYLIQIPSGQYVIGGTETTCFCWGSKQFYAKAGVVTNVGTIYIAREDGTSAWTDLATLHSSPDILNRGYTVADAMKITPPTEDVVVPDVISKLPIISVTYEDASGFGNHYGRLVNKMLPSDWHPGDKLSID